VPGSPDLFRCPDKASWNGQLRASATDRANNNASREIAMEMPAAHHDTVAAAPAHVLVVPNERKAPAPVFLGLNFSGNHSLVKDPAVRLPISWIDGRGPSVQNNHATEAGRGTQVDVWAIEQSIQRGYAVATFYYGDIVPDRASVSEGSIQPYFRKKGPNPGPH